MSITIWKYPLSTDREQIVEVPKKSQALAIQIQNSNAGLGHPLEFNRQVPTLWAIVKDDSPKVPVKIFCYGTGEKFENLIPQVYLGTAQVHGYVWHFFQERSDLSADQSYATMETWELGTA